MSKSLIRYLLTATKKLLRVGFRLTLFAGLFFGLGASAAPAEQALSVQMAQATAPHRFDFINWESTALLDEITRRWQPPPLPTSPAEQAVRVQTYLDQTTRLHTLQSQLDELYAGCPAETTCPAVTQQQIEALTRQLTTLKTEQVKQARAVEMILAQQVESVLRAEGLVTTGVVLPPVTFRLTEPPTALIISPRDRIEKQRTVQLQPGLDLSRRIEIETALNQRGDVSAYVTDIGGLGSYPAMVINHNWLPWLVETVAHEWVHNYLYTFPTNIAWGYQTFPRLTTINETSADIVGQEISREVITRFYPDWVEHLPPLDDSGQQVSPQPSEFHLAMRRIRLHVDDLLAQGRIEEAENFMKAERLKLVAQGYNLRKLNQAYFAFHGSYALSPASVDPIGPQLRSLRAASPSLKTFLNQVGWLNSYDDFQTWLAESSTGSPG